MLISDRFPYIEVEIAIGTWSLIEEVYLDTGFEAGLLIPAYLRHEILASPAWIHLKVANDETVPAPSWQGGIDFGSLRFRLEVAAMGSRFLLGRDIIDQLTVCFEHGQRITVQDS